MTIWARLSLDRLAEIACMSLYHWHHVFRSMTGETLAEVVRRLRLNLAANALLQGSDPVRVVAAQAGYTNLSSFSRAFKRAHGLSPDDFRKQGAKVTQLWEQNEMAEDDYPISVKELDCFAAAGASVVELKQVSFIGRFSCLVQFRKPH